ncbi:hypothetical protein TRIUR3_22079 [Triticum urartu]|uniref:Uncharacterized protein n=1 Tax=Triticum urartu TaxID=4572 RepID=M7YUR5_TRIUA|nr:hypothetical protein TRIUR3_22079 [Triticum urartu]
MVAGKPDRNLSYFNHKYNTRYLKHDDSVSFDCLRIRSIVLSILHSEQVRSSLDWERVRCKASQIVQHLAYKAPELRNVVLLPGGPMMPHDVLPIGFRYRRRRHVKEQDLPGPKTLAKIYLRTKKGLPSSTRRHELNSGLTDKTRKWLIDLIDESLQAGLELQSSEKEKEGVPGATASHTMSNTLTDLTKNSVSGTSSLTNAGAHVAPVSQTMSGTLTVPANISGAPVAAVSQTVNLTSHAENSGISSVINAVKRHYTPGCWSTRLPGDSRVKRASLVIQGLSVPSDLLGRHVLERLGWEHPCRFTSGPAENPHVGSPMGHVEAAHGV